MPYARSSLRAGSARGALVHDSKLAISEFPKWRKYLISLSFRDKSSVRPVQVGGFEANIVVHRSTAVRGRGGPPLPGSHLVAHGRALWKLTAPWTHRTRPPRLGKRCVFPRASTGTSPSNHPRKTPKGPKMALGNPDRPSKLTVNDPNPEASHRPILYDSGRPSSVIWFRTLHGVVARFEN